MIAGVVSVRVRDFIMTTEMPNPTATASAINWPGLISPVEGRTIMMTPTAPSTIAAIFQAVMRSPRNVAATVSDSLGACSPA